MKSVSRRIRPVEPPPKVLPDPGLTNSLEWTMEREMLARILIGVPIDSNEAVRLVRHTKLEPGDLTDQKHEALLYALYELADRGEAIDYITTAGELKKRGDLAKIGGPVALVDLVSEVPSSAGADYLAAELRIRAESGRTEKVLREMADALAQGAAHPLEARGRALELLRREGTV